MAQQTKKIKARDEYVNFIEKESKAKLGSLSKRQQSLGFVRFYVKQIHNKLRSEISDEDLELGLVDGANDVGIDFIHRDDGHVTIIQAKYRSGGTKEPHEDVSHFQSLLKRITDQSIPISERLYDRISDVDLKNDRINLIYLTFGEIANQAKAISTHQPAYPGGYLDLDQRCEWEFLDENLLNEEIRNAISIDSGMSEKTITLHPIGQKGQRGTSSVIQTQAGEFRSFLMVLDAKQIIKAYQEGARDALFSLNIRNFIGKTSTNKAIIATAKEKPESFFLFNNGISCLCTSLIDHDNRIEVTGLQVINGAQTVKALVGAGRRRPGDADPWPKDVPLVLARITEIPSGYGSAGRVRDDVTRYNNTQNVVKVSDFRSNDRVQLLLKDQFKEISRFGKPVSYVPKRTDYRPPNCEIVRLEEFSKSVYAFLEDPVAFSGSTSFLFDDSEGGGYNRIFGDGDQKWEKMPNDEFRLRASIYWLAQEFGERAKTDRETEVDADTRSALERKWMIVYSARKVLENYFPNELWKDQLRKAYRGEWRFGEGDRGKWFLRLYGEARSGVVLAYKNSRLVNPTFVHRNWMRSKDTPPAVAQILKEVILVTKDPIGPLPG